MNRTLKLLGKATGIGLLSGFVFCLMLSIRIVHEAERLAAANPMSAASIRCGSGNAAVLLPIFGIFAGAIFGLLMGGFLLLLHRLFHRQRLP